MTSNIGKSESSRISESLTSLRVPKKRQLFGLPGRIKKLGYKIKTILLFLANIFVTGF